MSKSMVSKVRQAACLGLLLLGWPARVQAQPGTSFAPKRGSSGPLASVSPFPSGSHRKHPHLDVQPTGTVYGWGLNASGQLGNNTLIDSASPLPVFGPGGAAPLTGVTQVVAGNDFTVALKSDGTLWTWGDNAGGELGNGTTTNSSTPIQVVGPGGVGFLTNIVNIAVGDNSCLALRTDGTVWAWGEDDDGEIGNGEMGIDVHTPTQVLGPGGSGFLTGVAAVVTSDYTVFALKADGTVWAWGQNEYGQLGNGTTTDSSVPVQVLGPRGAGYLTGIKTVEIIYYTAVALSDDGTVWAWGLNSAGELGDGTKTNSSTPVQVLDPGGTGYLTGITMIVEGYFDCFALRDDGAVWAWGGNGLGELGNDTTINSSIPVRVLGPGGAGYLTGIKTIVPVYAATIALGNDGTVWAWGYNGAGDLGHAPGTDGDTLDNYGSYYNVAPEQVTGPDGTGNLTGITTIIASISSGFAVRNDGTVWGWGSNGNGRLGIGSTAGNNPYPAQALGLTRVTALFAGPSDTFAIADTEVVSGTVLLQGEVSTAPLQSIDFVFTPNAGGAAHTFTAEIGPDGAFSLPTVPPGSYSVAIKGSKWLRHDITVDTTSGPVTDVIAPLLVGDVDNDNQVDLTDFSLLAAAYGSAQGSASWNANADLNGDGVVDLLDFNLLASNFGTMGDP